MLVFVIISSLFLFVYISKVIIKDRISKTVMSFYLIYYAVWFGISSINPYDLYNVSDIVYFIQFLGIFMFFIGFLFCKGFKANNNFKINSIVEFNLNQYKSIPIILLTLILVLTSYLVKYYKIIALNLIAGDARMVRFSKGELFSNWIEFYFFNYVIATIAIFCLVIIANSIINEKRFNLKFYLSFIYVVIYSLIGSGRGIIVNSLTFIILVKIISVIQRTEIKNSVTNSDQKNKSIKRNFISIVIFSALAILIMSYMTAFRKNLTEFNFENLYYGLNQLLKEGVQYFVGPFRAFEFALNNNYIDKTDFFWGRGTFAGIDEILGIPFILLGIEYNSSNNIIGNLLQYNTINVGSDTTFNYAYTHLMIFYFDFGIIGVIIFSLIFGYFVRSCINFFLYNPNFFTFAIVLFLFNTMLMSVFNWVLQSSTSIIFLISAYIFSGKFRFNNWKINYNYGSKN